jgi:uncharacterized protein
MKTTSLTVIAALGSALLAAGCVSAPDRQHPEHTIPYFGAPERSVSVSGTSTLYVKPDRVTVHFAVETSDPDLTKAKAANDAASRRVLEVIKSHHIEDRDVQTQVMRSGRDYEQTPDRHQRFVGYDVRREYAVTLRDLDQFEPLMDSLLASPEFTDQKYEFASSQRDQQLDQARQLAIRMAKQRAEAIAAELNCRLGTPWTISESTSRYEPSGSGGNLFGGGGGGDASSVAPLGQIEVTDTVNVSFELIPLSGKS